MILVGGQPKSLLDVMALSERMGWINDAEEFIGTRKLRNLLVHEYMTEPLLFLDALLAARPATELLFAVVVKVKQEATPEGRHHLVLSGHAEQDRHAPFAPDTH